MTGATASRVLAASRSLGRHVRRWITIAVIVAVTAGGGVIAWAMTGPSGPGYRTAVVARANITRTLVSTATIEPVSQAGVSFPVSGQVASVRVGLGWHVRAGQVLARLTTTALTSRVSAAQYKAAVAAVRLAADQASQATAASSPSEGIAARAFAWISRQQVAVRAAQQRLDARLTEARALLAAATARCAAAPAPTGSPSPSPSPRAAPGSPATSPGTASPQRPGGTQPPACQAAVTRLLSAQAGIAVGEQSLAGYQSALSSALRLVADTIGQAASSSSSDGAATGAPATAAQLAADQASLDAANAQLNVAKQNLAAATLVAPIAGTVARVNVAPGQQVSGSQGSAGQVSAGQGSGATASFVIDGAGGQEATTSVSSANVGDIRVGQPATVTLDGSAHSISGEVVAIGMLAATSSTGNASYPVTIGLATGTPTLFAGSGAQVAITLAKVKDAITVPTSAVHGTGAATFVIALRDGKPATVRVAVGAVGPTLTQVSSGLAAGDQVVLADMSTPLPTNTNPFARGLTIGGGGLGGGRAGGGGAGGGITRTGGGTSGRLTPGARRPATAPARRAPARTGRGQ